MTAKKLATQKRQADLKKAVRFNAVVNSKQESAPPNPFLRRLLLKVVIFAVLILLTFLYRRYVN